MEKPEKAENVILSTFMGIEIVKRNGENAVYCIPNAAYPEYFRCTNFNKYDESWDLLMPVVSKIKETNYTSGLKPENIEFAIMVFDYHLLRINLALCKIDLTELFTVVFSFIENYNNSINKPEEFFPPSK